MNASVWLGVGLPFGVTALGACGALFMGAGLNKKLNCAMSAAAAGVMTAAAIWSLLLPAIEQGSGMGRLSFVPTLVGFWLGVVFLFALDRLLPCPDREGGGEKTNLFVLAVTIHNFPEGMAVGIIYAGLMAGNCGVTELAAFSLALGIAVQNFPEGAIISMPLAAQGMKRGKAVLLGVASGAVEPIGALMCIAAARFFVPLMPYFLSFAAGAMIYVVVSELIPEAAEEKGGLCPLMFSLGFSLMMVLDVALG